MQHFFKLSFPNRLCYNLHTYNVKLWEGNHSYFDGHQTLADLQLCDMTLQIYSVDQHDMTDLQLITITLQIQSMTACLIESVFVQSERKSRFK